MGGTPTRTTVGRSRSWVRGSRIGERTASVPWLLGVTLFSFVLHLPFLNLPMISDEGGYAYVAQRWLDGRGTLYGDLWVSRPQGIFLAYAAIFHTIGTSVVALRIGAWLVTIATMLVVWRFANAWTGGRHARLATLLFAVIAASPAIEGFTANAEVFMALPAAGCAMVILTASRTGWRTGHLLGIGALAALATFLKPSGIVMLPVGVAYAALVTDAPWRTVARRSTWMGLGFALTLAPAFVHGYLVGWHNFVFAAITYRITHQSSATNSLHHHLNALRDLFYRIWPILAAVLLPLLIRWCNQAERWRRQWSAEVLGARVGIVSWPGSRPRLQPGDDATLLMRLWLLGCLAGIAMGGDWWFHYLIQIAAPLAIWLAATLFDVRRMLGDYGRWGLGLLVGLFLLWPFNVLANGSPVAITKAIYGHPGYPDQAPVAAYLREHCPPETPIFVAFDQAALYYLSDRPAIYRYLYDQELRAFPNSEAELIALIESPDRPMYIVGTRQVAPFEDRGEAFWRAVSRNYHYEVSINGVPIYRANVAPVLLYPVGMGWIR